MPGVHFTSVAGQAPPERSELPADHGVVAAARRPRARVAY
jgi:hypothetical protein